MKISRRSFLFRSILLGSVAGLGWGVFSAVEMPLVRRILKNNLSTLSLPDDLLDAFIHDFKADLQAQSETRSFYTGLVLGGFATPFYRLGWIDLRTMEESVITQFLLSTNFFREPEVEAGRAPLRYKSFFSYREPCRNPFARFS